MLIVPLELCDGLEMGYCWCWGLGWGGATIIRNNNLL